MSEDLELLARRVESSRRYLLGVGALPELALEAVEDIRLGLRDFAVRWLEDLTPEQRQHLAATFAEHDGLRAEIDRIAAEIGRRDADVT